MKIKSIKISNYHSIQDTELKVNGNLLAIAGGNESGKSNILSAIDKFLQFKDFGFSDTYKLSNNSQPIIEVTFNQLTLKEKEIINRLYIFDEDLGLTISREGNTYKIINAKVLKIEEPSTEEIIPEVVPEPAEASTGTAPVDNQEDGVVENTHPELEKTDSDISIPDEVKDILPTTTFVGSIEQLIVGDNIPIQELFNDTSNPKYNILRKFLAIGNLQETEIREPNQSKRAELLKKGAAKIGQKLKTAWSQEDLKIEIYSDLNSLSILLRDGKNLPTEDDDTRWIWTLPEERSTGFRWYMTFYALFLSEMENKEEFPRESIFLIDDAGILLNKVAQEDLLKKFKDLTNNSTNQIIYVTHAKDMIEWDTRQNIMFVEKRPGEGTIINSKWWASYSSDKLSAPLNELGISWSQDLLGDKNLIVEGHSDLPVLYGLIRIFADSTESNKIMDYKLVPAGNASDILDLVKLCEVLNKKYFYLFDSDVEGKNRYDTCQADHYTRGSHLALLSESESIFTIEDLLPEKLYIEEINKTGSKIIKEWEEIKFFRDETLEDKGIVEAIKQRLATKFTPEEVKMVVSAEKYIINTNVMNRASQESYEPEKIEILKTFIKNLNNRLD